MSFDNSRYTFNPFKDYSSVVMPQGRVQSDADWNEFLQEITRRVQAGTLDTMGRAAYPLTTPDAFYISPGSTPWVVNLGLGRMYVDGLLAENHGLPPGAWDPALEELSGVPQPQPTTVTNTPSIPFTSQPYLPAAAAALSGATQYLPNGAGSYVYYLDVWKRAVTWLQDPTLIDSAIGIDTSGRMQTVWQVRWMSANTASVPVTCQTADADIAYPFQSAGQLSTQALPNPSSGPCCMTPGNGYTGLENQFYRVQIHKGGPLGTATFKWSRENASVATSILSIANKGNAAGNQATVLTVTSLGRDQVLNFSNGNWVELLDDNVELDGMPDANYPTGSPYTFGNPGLLCQIDYVDPTTNEIYLVTPPITDARFPVGTPSTSVHTRLVRWDESGVVFSSDLSGTQTATTNALSTGDILTPADGSTMLVLENGITVTFNVSAASGNFLSGDYWTFAARTDGTMDPPALQKAPPRGIQHHYTKLSVVTFDGSGNVTNSPDCRIQWGCGCSGDCGCCTVTVGDNVTSFGTYSSIQQAIYNLPAAGGEVCILPGKYYELVVLSGQSEVTLKGSGPQTILYPPSSRPPGTTDQGGNTVAPATNSGLNAVVTIAGSQHIELTGFTIEAPAGMVGVLLDSVAQNTQTEFVQAQQQSMQARVQQMAKQSKISFAAGTFQQMDVQPDFVATESTSGQTVNQQVAGGEIQYKIPPEFIDWNNYGQGYTWVAPAFVASNTDVTLTDMLLTAINFPAIASVQASDVEISDNRIFMQDTAGLWPAVYISGSTTAIKRNWIGLEDIADAGSLASDAIQSDLAANFKVSGAASVGNGGIQVGGYSNTISITENQLEGGAFNAITLGGYVLMSGTTQAAGLQGLFPASPAAGSPPSLVLPANVVNSLLAADGPLQDIRIEKNRISNCGLCGIGPVGYFNGQSPETISISGLSILGNTITATMQAAPAALPTALAGTVAYGAICLPDLQNTIIRDNIITDFGSAPGAQVCGIFVLNGEQVEISRNQVVETRDWLAINTVPATNGGMQAGVAIAMVSPPALNQSTSQVWSGSSTQGVTTAGSPPIYQPGMPALRMDQNVVRVPLGYSLTVLGYGPFSITGNQLTTGGTVMWAGGTPPIALNIFILNLGLPVEFDKVTSFANLWSYAYGAYGPPSLSSVDTALGNSTNGTILFAHNQCQVETRGSAAGAPFATFIASLDHLNYANNLSWIDGIGAPIPGTVGGAAGGSLAALSDALLIGITLQVSANRFQEQATSVLLSGVTAGLLNVTTSNISTLCLVAVGAIKSIANNISYYSAEVCSKYQQYLLDLVVAGLMVSGATLPETAAATSSAGASLAGEAAIAPAAAQSAQAPAPAQAPAAPPAAAPAPAPAVQLAQNQIPALEAEVEKTAVLQTSAQTAAQTAAQAPAEAATQASTQAAAQTATQASVSTSASNVTTAVPKAALQADATSASGMQAMLQTHQARLAQVTRIAAVVSAQPTASAAQVTAAKAAVTSTQAAVARVAMLKQRVTAQPPTVPATGWGVYGSVYNGSNAPVQGYSVYIVDGTNTYQNVYGIAYTQADGSYSFVYAGPAAGQAAPSGQLFLQVADANGNPVYTSSTAFVPTTGAATYQAITLPAVEKPLGVLPTVLRAITLPTLEKIAPQAATDTTTGNE